jgi:hypothetical protein
MKSDKLSSLLIILLLVASSIVIAYPARGSVSKPSVPEFSVAYVDHSYDTPPVYGKDPYTGQTTVKVYSIHVDNRTIDVTIQNQPFTPYLDSNNNTIGLYYNIRSKGHFDDWSDSSVHTTNGVQASTTSVSTLVSIDIGYWGVQQGVKSIFRLRLFQVTRLQMRLIVASSF